MKIKILIFATVLLSASVLAPGCKDDLNIVQNSRISSGNMWKTEQDIRSAVYGMYDYLRTGFKSNLLYWGEYRNGLWGPGTNGVLHNTDQGAVLSGTMNSTNAYANWAAIYTTINQANLIIKYTGQVATTQDTKDFALANAYFVRAYCYFWIARIWGDAPLPLNGFENASDDLYLTKTAQAELLKQVEADIKLAEASVKTTFTSKTVVTPAAVAMLKTDYALWMYSVAKAGDTYLALAEAGILTAAPATSKLETAFNDIFKSTNQLGKEIILALYQENGESTGGFVTEQLWNRSYLKAEAINVTVPIGENQWWCYNRDYINLILSDPTDQRASVTYGRGPYSTSIPEIGWANKFTGEMISGTRVFNSDIILYRYAQAYTFDAEIKYYRKNYSGALAALNTLANRAYGKANYYTDQSDASVLDAIVKENLKEFASEGNTWWMLIRTDKIWNYNASLAAQKTKKNILLWPITQASLNRNYNLTQTEGWQ